MMSNWDRYASGRRADLPSNWSKIRARVLRRDSGLCQVQDDGCEVIAVEADHIDGRTNHAMSNLQAICKPCHVKKTQGESTRSQNARRKAIKSRFRREEQHPGVMGQ